MTLNLDKVNKPWISFLTESEIEFLEQDLECSICLDIYKDPVITNCQHIFCKTCLDSALNKSKDCPLCRTKITKINFNPEKVISIVKNSLKLGSSANSLDSLKTLKDRLQYERCLSKIPNLVTRGQYHKPWRIKFPKDLKDNVYFKIRNYIEQKGFCAKLNFNKEENKFFLKIYKPKEENIK